MDHLTPPSQHKKEEHSVSPQRHSHDVQSEKFNSFAALSPTFPSETKLSLGKSTPIQ
jgi:hypothetical protein